MEHRCTICNSYYDTLSYRGGHICEECLNSIKTYGILDSEFDAW